MVAELQCRDGVARDDAHPARCGHAHDQGVVGLEHQHRAVVQGLVARQCDGDVLSARRDGAKAAALKLRAFDGEHVHQVPVREMMDRVG